MSANEISVKQCDRCQTETETRKCCFFGLGCEKHVCLHCSPLTKPALCKCETHLSIKDFFKYPEEIKRSKKNKKRKLFSTSSSLKKSKSESNLLSIRPWSFLISKRDDGFVVIKITDGLKNTSGIHFAFHLQPNFKLKTKLLPLRYPEYSNKPGWYIRFRFGREKTNQLFTDESLAIKIQGLYNAQISRMISSESEFFFKYYYLSSEFDGVWKD